MHVLEGTPDSDLEVVIKLCHNLVRTSPLQTTKAIALMLEAILEFEVDRRENETELRRLSAIGAGAFHDMLQLIRKELGDDPTSPIPPRQSVPDFVHIQELPDGTPPASEPPSV